MRTHHTLRLHVPIAALAMLASACGDDADAPASPPVDDLAGRTFLSTDASTFEIVDGTTVTVSFQADGTIGVNGGCNSIGGPYTIDDDVLVADDLASTMMACDDALMDQDDRLTELLTSRPAISIEGETLTIGEGSNQLVLAEQQPAALEGTVWNVTGVIDGDAVSSVPDGATIVFADGEVRFDSGCNSGSGTATIGDGTVEIGPVASTKKGCPDDVAALETAITSVLAGTVDVEIDGNALTITNGDAGLTLSAGA